MTSVKGRSPPSWTARRKRCKCPGSVMRKGMRIEANGKRQGYGQTTGWTSSGGIHALAPSCCLKAVSLSYQGQRIPSNFARLAMRPSLGASRPFAPVSPSSIPHFTLASRLVYLGWKELGSSGRGLVPLPAAYAAEAGYCQDRFAQSTSAPFAKDIGHLGNSSLRIALDRAAVFVLRAAQGSSARSPGISRRHFRCEIGWHSWQRWS